MAYAMGHKTQEVAGRLRASAMPAHLEAHCFQAPPLALQAQQAQQAQPELQAQQALPSPWRPSSHRSISVRRRRSSHGTVTVSTLHAAPHVRATFGAAMQHGGVLGPVAPTARSVTALLRILPVRLNGEKQFLTAAMTQIKKIKTQEQK